MTNAIRTILLENPTERWVVDYGRLWHLELKNPKDVLLPEHILPDMANPTAFVIANSPADAKMLGIHVWCIYNPEELDPQPIIECSLLTQGVFLPNGDVVVLTTHVIQSWADFDPSRIAVNPFNRETVTVKRL